MVEPVISNKISRKQTMILIKIDARLRFYWIQGKKIKNKTAGQIFWIIRNNRGENNCMSIEPMLDIDNWVVEE